MEQKLLDVLNNLCNGLIADGEVYEEVIDMLVEAGATISVLKAVGFSDIQLDDYAYYVSMLDDVPESEVLDRLKEQ